MKNYAKIFLFTILISKCIKIYSVNTLYIILSKVNGYFHKVNGNKYLPLVSTNGSKEKIKVYEGLWSKIRDLISLITKK